MRLRWLWQPPPSSFWSRALVALAAVCIVAGAAAQTEANPPQVEGDDDNSAVADDDPSDEAEPRAAESTDEDSDKSSDEGGRIARTREERRAAGLKLEFGEWFTLSGLADLESTFQRVRLVDLDETSTDNDFSGTLELGLEIQPISWAKVELLYEFDGSSDLDEATLSIERHGLELELGRLYVPFGEYFSHFITGPMLEFGETRSAGGVLSYALSDRLDVSAFLHHGLATQVDSDGPDLDWGLAVEGSPLGSVTFALSYTSDLADSKHEILEDQNDEYRRRVPGLSAYGLFSRGPFEVTVEFVLALNSFEEFPEQWDQPRAWNVELAYFPLDALELDLRIEGSAELQDAPRTRAGVAAAWRIIPHVYVRGEFLHGWYEPGLAMDKDGHVWDQAQQIGFQLSIE